MKYKKLTKEFAIKEEIINEILYGKLSWDLRRGELTMFNYLDLILGKFPEIKIELHKIEEIWFNSYEINYKMVELIKNLREKYLIGTISGNIKERIAYLEKKYSFRNLFSYEIYSCDVGIDKNDIQIFEYAINKYNLDPRTCLLIDDNDDCLQAAEAIGFKVSKYIEFEDLERKCNEL